MLDEFAESIHYLIEPIFDQYPNLKRYFETICELPSIKKYSSERELLPYNSRAAKFGGVFEKKIIDYIRN